MSNASMTTPYQPITITHIKEEVPGVKTFVFGGEDARTLTYLPGQYLTLVAQQGPEEVRRSYSITSSPALQEPLAIGVKRVENGLLSRRVVDNARVGDVLYTTGAAGFFTLPEDLFPYQQVFFWAAGSGITPIYSLLKTLLHEKPQMSLVLIYSNRSEEATIYLTELRQLAAHYPNQLQIRFLFSNNPRLDEARLHKAFLHRLMQAYTIVPSAQILCYICGPEHYRRLCLYGLREIGVPTANIRQETFDTTKPSLKISPPDVAARWVLLQYNGQQYQFLSQYPDTILQSARKAGILMPYSCEAGKCGNCAARCVEGEVWMSYNEVLTDRDVAQGLTLTCVGYPVGGDVRLQMK
jgi:ring-1,2-phenylacetyl-CoA epoxidase subunit PaaE